MPLQSTFASNTVKGYRTESGVATGDPHWDDVVLLIQPQAGDTEAIDYSSFNTTITAQRQSKAVVATQTDPYGISNVVLNFQPSNNQIVTVDQVADRIATSTDPDTWTMEGWFNIDNNTDNQVVFFGMHGNTYSPDNNPHVDNFVVFWHGNNGNTGNVPRFYKINENGSTAEDLGVLSSTNTVVDQWYHLAIVNNGGTLNYYIDGTRVLEETGYTFPTVRSDDSFQLGADQDNTTTNDFLNGQCSEFRVTRNVARYTGASFSVPTSRFLQAGGIVGASAEFPATSEAEAITYLNTQNGSSSTSLIWLKHPQVNGNTPYRVAAIIDQGYVYALCGKMGSQNPNTQTASPSGKPPWMWNNNPGGSTTNDWGTDTHTFNASDALDTGDFDLSQRSRNWPELASRYKRVYYASIDTVGTGDVIYKGTRGTTAHGPTLSWGELMEQVPAYALNNGDGGDSHKFPNEAGVAVAALSRVATGSGLSATQYDHLYLGFSDNEAVPTSTNDAAMIIGRTGLVQQTTPAFSSSQSPAIFGLGGKRSSFNTSTGFAETNASPPATPNDSGTGGSSDNNHGMICTYLSNGNMGYDFSATVTFYTRFQGGDGSTAAKAFEGSPGDLDKIWYGGSIPDGLYYFKSTNSNLGTVRLRVENGFAKIPTGTSSITGSDVTSATLTNSNFHTKYYDGAASSNASELVFDASNRFNNINNSASSPNSALGYILFDLGIPFRRSFIELTVQSATATGSGADNADWDGTADSTGWTAGNLTYSGLSGTPDLPFAVLPTNDTNQFRTLSGHTTNNSSTVASGGWTGSGDQGNVTRSWTSTVIDCGQAAERTQFGFGMMGFNNEEYRFNEGFWYLR